MEFLVIFRYPDSKESEETRSPVSTPESMREYPQSLSLSEWLVFSLKADDETDRLLALEEISGRPPDPEITALLQGLQEHSDSETIREKAGKALQIQLAWEETRAFVHKMELTPDGFRTLAEDANPVLRKEILRSIRGTPSPELLDVWRNDLVSGVSAAKTEIALAMLGRFGSTNDAGFALPFLGTENPEIEIWAWDLLCTKDPALFKERIAEALISANPDVQIHAVRRLRQVDPPAALPFIGALLENPDPFVRQKALRVLPLIPFTEAEAICLRFLSREPRPLLVVIASLGVALDPQPELPERLFDILLVAGKVKKGILQIRFNQLVSCIHKAGILTVPVEEYVAGLRARLQTRKETLAVRLALQDLRNANPATRISALERLRPFLHLSEVRTTLATLGDGETAEEVKAVLAGIPLGEASPTTDITHILKNHFSSLDTARQQQALAAISSPDLFRHAHDAIRKIVSDRAHPTIIATCLDLLGRFGSREESSIPALGMLKHADPMVVAAAIRTLGKTDPESFLPHLNRFLQNPDPRICVAALEFFMQSDREGAIRFLESLMESMNPRIRDHALTLVPQLDTASAFPILEKAVRFDPDPEIQTKAAFLLAVEPGSEALSVLAGFCLDESLSVVSGRGDLWGNALKNGAAALGRTAGEIEAGLLEERRREKTFKKPEPTYSFRNLQNKSIAFSRASRPPPAASPTPPSRLRQWLGYACLALFMVSPLLWYFLNQPPDESGFHQEGLPPALLSEGFGSRPTSTTVTGLRMPIDGILGKSILAQKAGQIKKECQESADRIEQARLKHLSSLAADESLPPWRRMAAIALSDTRFTEAGGLMAGGDFSAAAEKYKKILDDPNSGIPQRVLACQGLITTTVRGGEPAASALPHVDQYFREVQKIQGSQGAPMAGFAELMTDANRKMAELKTGENFGRAAQALAEADKIAVSKAEELLRSRLDIGHQGIPGKTERGEK
jgi:HEAT repeat protein